MTRRKSQRELRRGLELDALGAYQRHHGSTTQREDAAADLGMELATFRALIDDARRHGFDIEAVPERQDP